MGITTTNPAGMIVNSAAKNGTLAAQTLATDTTIEMVLDTGVGTNNGEVTTASNIIGAAGPTLIGRTVILRREDPTEETRYVTACVLSGGCTIVTVSEPWTQAPADGDTYDFAYLMDDVLTLTGMSFAKKTGIFTSTRELSVDGVGTFAYLAMLDGLGWQPTEESTDYSLRIAASAQLDIGYLFGATIGAAIGVQSIYIVPVNDNVADNLILGEAGSTTRFYDFVIRTTQASLNCSVLGGSHTWERGKTFRILEDSTLFNVKASDIVFEGTAGASIQTLDINTASEFNQIRLIQTGGFIATDTLGGSTLTIKNVNFINNFRNVTVASQQIWNVINPTWDIDASTQNEIQFSASAGNLAAFETTRALMPAATGWPASAAAAAHFMVRTVASTYYVWYSVAGAATDPAAPGTGIEITGVASADLAASVVTKTVTSINAFTGFGSTSFTATASGATVTLTNVQAGPVTPFASSGTAASDVDASVIMSTDITGSVGIAVSALVNELYSLDITIADPGGSAVASAVAYIYEGTCNLDLPNQAITNASGVASTLNVLNITYQASNQVTLNTSTFGNFALKIYKYNKLPFVAAHPSLTEVAQAVTMLEDTAITQTVQATASSEGSNIEVLRETTPGTLLGYADLQGPVQLGEAYTAAGGATGVAKEDTSISSSSGVVFFSARNATAFVDAEAVERDAAPGSTLFTTNASAHNKDYTWHVNACTESLTTTYDFLGALMAGETPPAIFISAIQWGEEEQGLLLQSGTDGFFTQRNINLAEGIYISNRGAGTVDFFQSDAGSNFAPPVQRTFTLTGLESDSEIRLLSSDANLDFVGGTESSSGSSFQHSYIFAADQSVILVVFHLNFKDIRIPNIVLGNADQSIPIQQQTDRVYSNP